MSLLGRVPFILFEVCSRDEALVVWGPMGC